MEELEKPVDIDQLVASAKTEAQRVDVFNRVTYLQSLIGAERHRLGR